MAFIVTFIPVRDEYKSLRGEQVRELGREVVGILYDKQLYSNLARSLRLDVLVDDRQEKVIFSITFDGLSVTIASVSFVIMQINQILRRYSAVSGFFLADGASNRPIDGDRIFNIAEIPPVESPEDRLLKEFGVDDEEVSDRYKCSIAKTVMVEPVYLEGNSEVRYERMNLERALVSNGMKDPFRRVSVTVDDIKECQGLREEILEFTKRKIDEAIDDEVILKSYQEKALTGGKEWSLEWGLRAAAAISNDVDAIRCFLRKGVDVDAQDPNPEKRKTALHLAVKLKKREAISCLLELGASFEIKDAQGKDALDYVLDSEDDSIKALFPEEALEERERMRRGFGCGAGGLA